MNGEQLGLNSGLPPCHWGFGATPSCVAFGYVCGSLSPSNSCEHKASLFSLNRMPPSCWAGGAGLHRVKQLKSRPADESNLPLDYLTIALVMFAAREAPHTHGLQAPHELDLQLRSQACCSKCPRELEKNQSISPKLLLNIHSY
jgi:hypothetical protein